MLWKDLNQKTVENLKKNIQVTAKDDTEIIAISVTEADSEMGRKIAGQRRLLLQ